MAVSQTAIKLRPYRRGFHLITREIEQATESFIGRKSGLLQLFIQHTSASLTINENADMTVRQDFEQVFNRLVPENQTYYQHTYEGPDDLPAHIKSSLLGHSVTIPVREGEWMLGTWQGVYLGEHRDHASGRTLFVTFIGE